MYKNTVEGQQPLCYNYEGYRYRYSATAAAD